MPQPYNLKIKSSATNVILNLECRVFRGSLWHILIFLFLYREILLNQIQWSFTDSFLWFYRVSILSKPPQSSIIILSFSVSPSCSAVWKMSDMASRITRKFLVSFAVKRFISGSITPPRTRYTICSTTCIVGHSTYNFLLCLKVCLWENTNEEEE